MDPMPVTHLLLIPVMARSASRSHASRSQTLVRYRILASTLYEAWSERFAFLCLELYQFVTFRRLIFNIDHYER